MGEKYSKSVLELGDPGRFKDAGYDAIKQLLRETTERLVAGRGGKPYMGQLEKIEVSWGHLFNLSDLCVSLSCCSLNIFNAYTHTQLHTYAYDLGNKYYFFKVSFFVYFLMLFLYNLFIFKYENWEIAKHC